MSCRREELQVYRPSSCSTVSSPTALSKLLLLSSYISLLNTTFRILTALAMSSVIYGPWIASQKPRVHTMRSAPIFYRNVEEALDIQRKDHKIYTLLRRTWPAGSMVDFCCADSLAFGASGRLRRAFDEVMTHNPIAILGAGGSRLMNGNYDYIETVEQEIADYHGVEAALKVGSGCNSNYAIFESIPRPGDAIIYDELVHASIFDGISRSLASTKMPFAHDDADALREVLLSIWESQPLIKQGKKCVIVVVESFYSMDGDMAPLAKLIQVAQEIFPGGNAHFIVDEAHSSAREGWDSSMRWAWIQRLPSRHTLSAKYSGLLEVGGFRITLRRCMMANNMRRRSP